MSDETRKPTAFELRLKRDFIDGYLTTALWSSTDDDDEPLDSGKWDWSDEARESLTAEALAWYDAHFDIHAEFDAEQVGHDLWLTRNGHGVGFWDREEIYGVETAKVLSDLAHSLGEVWLYTCDNAEIHCTR